MAQFLLIEERLRRSKRHERRVFVVRVVHREKLLVEPPNELPFFAAFLFVDVQEVFQRRHDCAGVGTSAFSIGPFSSRLLTVG